MTNYIRFCRKFSVTKFVLRFEKSRRVMCNLREMICAHVNSFNDQLFCVLRTLFTVCFRGDRLCFRAPTFVILALICSRAFADFDLGIGGTTRSYPLAGVVEADAGYDILLYGTKKAPFSGYTRVKIDGSSAYTYNSLGGAVEFFPLAFVGARAGGEAIQNDKDYRAYDCDTYRCLGRFYRTYIETELTLGAGPVFVQGRWRREHWTQKDPLAGDFIEPTSGFAVHGEGDHQTVYYGIAGVKFSPAWSFLGVLRYAESDLTQAWSRFPYGALVYKSGDFSIGAGAGVFESNIKDKAFSALGFLRWQIAPSLALE